jgi:glucose/arabinose dehydrogenase
MHRGSIAVALLVSGLLVGGCYRTLAGGQGGARSRHLAQRVPDAADVAVPAGYRAEVVAAGFTFPIGVAFDGEGRPVVLEAGYSYGEVFTVPRLVRVAPDGTRAVLLEGPKGGPWTGLIYRDGAFFVADGGQTRPGRILRIDEASKEVRELVTDLPTFGDHHTNGPALGPDGKLYFGTGTATNSGVVGIDNHQFGWLPRFPRFHDVPCEDLRLTGWTAETENPLTPGQEGKVRTGAFQPFGTHDAQLVKGQVPCSGAVMRVGMEGGPPELVAWGFRNPFGLAFDAAGGLWVTDNGYDVRGSRPVWGSGDMLWKVEHGRWYGFPDHTEGHKLQLHADPGSGVEPPSPLLAEYPGEVPSPVARFGVHSSSNGLDLSPGAAFGYPGHVFVAQFGDLTPTTGKLFTPVGFRVVRVEPETGVIHTFATNRSGSGPASALGDRGFERPTAVRFDPAGRCLYVVDFGVMAVTEKGPWPQQETGVLWRICRQGQQQAQEVRR